MSPTVLELDEDIAGLKIFGLIPVPHIFHEVLTTRVRAQGPQTHTITVRTDAYYHGTYRRILSWYG
jgi:hypothetical protein